MRPTTPSVPLKLKVFAMVAACAFRAAETLSVTSFSGTGSLSSGRVDLSGDEDPIDEDGDNGMGDPTGGSMSLGGVEGSLSRVEKSVEEDDRKHAHFCGGKISSGRKKSQGSNSGDGDNTGDGGKKHAMEQ
ncbi:hypothetical protein Tco_0514357 [Tanacetum coccineum]